jgi:uncharacterized OsmC-like protein
MVNYPINFSSNSKAEEGEESWKLETSEGLQAKMTVPEDFGGDDEHPSPEDLFTASIQTCVVATFKSIAERKGLDYTEIKSEIEASLDRGEDSRPLMKEAKVTLEVKGVEDQEKASEVASATDRNCFIHKSVKTDIETEYKYS